MKLKKPDYNICDICWMHKKLKIKERMSSDGNTESKAKQSKAGKQLQPGNNQYKEENGKYTKGNINKVVLDNGNIYHDKI